MVAALQRTLSLLALAAAVGWAAWCWPSPHAAWALLLLAPHAPVLAIEFAWMQSVNRSARGPAVLRAWAAEVLQGWRVFGWRQPWRAQAVPDALAPRDPGLRGVVLVHGFVCNRGFWTPWLRRLRAQGRAFAAVTLEPVGAPIESHAPALADAVARVVAATGGQAPLVVAHSMGGLVVRAWLAGGGQAHRVVTIGTPHAGTELARLGRTACGRQMRRGSAWLQALAQSEAAVGYAGFTCWWSDCDNIVFPAETATLPGADNRGLPGLPHVGLAFDPRVLAHTLDLLRKE